MALIDICCFHTRCAVYTHEKILKIPKG